MNRLKTLLATGMILIGLAAWAQVENAGGVRKRTEREKKEEKTGAEVTDRMQGFFETKEPHDADLSYMKQIYRRLDLEKPANTALYYPEDIVDGQENLFRIIMRLVVDGQIPAYEYLDGREIFTDQYKVNVGDMLDRFGIYAQQARGSTERNPKYFIEEADVPSGQVMNYYILEKWEFDRRSNAMKTRVEAICPVLNRSGDFGGEARYPMFWVKFDALRPYLAQQYIFINDDNNLPQYSLDDYFNLGMYDGEIYKTRNLRNLSMAQMYPDEDDMKRAQDSIDNHLRNFGKNLWVPTREEYLAMKEQEELMKKNSDNGETIATGDELPERSLGSAGSEGAVSAAEPAAEAKSVSSRAKKTSSTKKAKKPAAKKPKVSNSGSSPNTSAEKSVRRRKK
ncbi:MAG: gliding motility protein GldN [Muribaculaceae bacterium]|nr:gliding motility protein GldN [Muribaculaceae bacterium]